MATDFFLKIDSIPGESTDEKHKGEIELDSWSLSVTNHGSMGSGGGGGSGKANWEDLVVTKRVCKATPKLLKSASEGSHIKNMLLTCRKAGGGGGQVEYLKVTLDDVFCAGYHVANGQESFTLNYAKIKYEYAPQKMDGSLEGFVAAGYDRHLNKAS